MLLRASKATRGMHRLIIRSYRGSSLWIFSSSSSIYWLRCLVNVSNENAPRSDMSYFWFFFSFRSQEKMFMAWSFDCNPSFLDRSSRRVFRLFDRAQTSTSSRRKPELPLATNATRVFEWLDVLFQPFETANAQKVRNLELDLSAV